MILLAERSLLTSNNEPTPEEPLPREMTPRRASFLMIATLLLLCGSMLLFLDLAANASGTHGQVAMIGLVLVAIGGSCLWADFFEVTSWFARERWVTGHVPPGYTRLAQSGERELKIAMKRSACRRQTCGASRSISSGVNPARSRS